MNREQDTDQVQAAYMMRLNAALQRQASNGWPRRLRLPMPQNAAEQEALDLWIAEFRHMTGADIQVDMVTEGEA